MKKALLLLGALGALTAGSFGQTLVARWDLDHSDKISGDWWSPGAHFAYDESPFEDCVDLDMTTTTGWSNRTPGNGTPEFHCFGQFDAYLNKDKYVSWTLTFSNEAVGSLTSFDFDIRNYTGSPDAFKVAWFANGSLVGYDKGSFGTDWSEHSIALSGLESEFGSTDTFEIRLFAYDKDKEYGGRIGLDNISIYGDHVVCIPEPSTALLGILGLLPFALRRRR